MRAAIRLRFPMSWGGLIGQTLKLTTEYDVQVEDQLRTYMLNGTDPEEFGNPYFPKHPFAEIELLQAALQPFAAIPLWRDTYPDAKHDELAVRQMQGLIQVKHIRAARLVLGQAAETKK
jgi:hypothetical protein